MKNNLVRVRQAGFTLIEMMVVVVVIGVLAAMIIPKFVSTTYDAKVSAAKGSGSPVNRRQEMARPIYQAPAI
jgi:general secretion pathway protein G